jgi:kinesin family protein 5
MCNGKGAIDDEVNRGLTPRMVNRIFEKIHQSPSDIEFTVKVSFMEIYMERVRDLLNPTSENLPIHEDRNRGVYVKGLLEIFVASVDEVLRAMRKGDQARATSPTKMNLESSRSHTIFMMQITQKNLVTGATKIGKLSLVDLAGSEKVSRSGVSGLALQEAKKINQSLSTLGLVINALTEDTPQFVPYRNSKLTRILQESIGGNSRTTLIINCSSSESNESETLSTLRFGVRQD